jgi:hypothetical protein
MNALRLVYHLIVLYLTVQLLWYIFRERRLWAQASTVLVLALFLLRLFWIK